MRFLLVAIWLMLPGVPLSAQGVAPEWTTVLDLATGDPRANVRFDPDWQSFPSGFPFAESRPWPALAEERQPKAGGMKLPTRFQDRPVKPEAFRRTPGGRMLVFLGKPQAPGAESTTGDWVVADPASAEVLFELHHPCKLWLAGRTWGFQPGIAVWANYAALDTPKQTTRVVDLDTGKTLFSVPAPLRCYEHLTGIWSTGGALFLQIGPGLARVDPATGKVLWTYPHVGQVFGVRPGPDGKLYVRFEGDPQSLTHPLREAAEKRYPGQRITSGVVPYQGLFFGSTHLGGGEKIAIWERLQGRWSWIFDYSVALAEVERDRLFAKQRLSPAMRKRLEWQAP